MKYFSLWNVKKTQQALAYAGFSKGGPGNLRIIKTKKQKSPLRISPFSSPKLGEDQKKGLHSDLVRFLTKN